LLAFDDGQGPGKVLGLADDADLLDPVEHGPKALSHHQVIVDDHDVDGGHDHAPAFRAAGIRTSIAVPSPGRLDTSRSTPSSAARSLMPARPNEMRGRAARIAARSKPFPSSSTRRTTSGPLPAS